MKAAPLVEDALERSGLALGEKLAATVRLTALLAHIDGRLQRFEKAESLAIRAVELRRELLGEEHPATLNAVAILARIYVQQGQFEKAGPFTKRAFELATVSGHFYK